MEGAKMVLLEVVIYIGAAAALFTGLDVFLALKAARRGLLQVYKS